MPFAKTFDMSYSYDYVKGVVGEKNIVKLIKAGEPIKHRWSSFEEPEVVGELTNIHIDTEKVTLTAKVDTAYIEDTEDKKYEIALVYDADTNVLEFYIVRAFDPSELKAKRTDSDFIEYRGREFITQYGYKFVSDIIKGKDIKSAIHLGDPVKQVHNGKFPTIVGRISYLEVDAGHDLIRIGSIIDGISDGRHTIALAKKDKENLELIVF